MLKQVGKFKTNKSGVIHISSEEDYYEFSTAVSALSKSELEKLPLVILDYEEKGDVNKWQALPH